MTDNLQEWYMSTADYVKRRKDHSLSEGRRLIPKCQQHILVQKVQIIYFLRAGDGHQRVGNRFAAKRPDHLHPEGRRWPPKGQQQVLHQRDQITYSFKLRTGDGHQRVSSRY